jgi:hypothetical protein
MILRLNYKKKIHFNIKVLFIMVSIRSCFILYLKASPIARTFKKNKLQKLANYFQEDFVVGKARPGNCTRIGAREIFNSLIIRKKMFLRLGRIRS